MAVVPYADTSFAYEYFSDRLRTDAWDDASDEDKIKGLKQATKAIDNLNFAGDKTDDAQDRQFPRGGDTDVPDMIKQACCELALAFLDGIDASLEMENLSLVRGGIGEARFERDTAYVQDHIRAGIPSIQAWYLLLPFLRDPNARQISRGTHDATTNIDPLSFI